VEQEDQGDHNPRWWTRTGLYILLMSFDKVSLFVSCSLVNLLLGRSAPAGFLVCFTLDNLLKLEKCQRLLGGGGNR